MPKPDLQRGHRVYTAIDIADERVYIPLPTTKMIVGGLCIFRHAIEELRVEFQ